MRASLATPSADVVTIRDRTWLAIGDYWAHIGDVALMPRRKPRMPIMNAITQVRTAIATKPVQTDAEIIASLRVQLAQAQQRTERKLSLKVSEKGAVSLYGLGRFPVTLYAGQWERLLASADDIRTFLAANAALLSVKS